MQCHHLVPRSRGGSNNEENLVWLQDNIHVAFHQVFSNKMPHEQIIHLLELNQTALNPSFYSRLWMLIEETDKDKMYKRKALVE